MPSKIEIINLALTNLGAELVISLDEETELVSRVNNIYELTKKSVLESHPWGFASKRIQLAPSINKPAFEFDNAFPLPSDFLRVISLYPEEYQIKYTIESGHILANESVLNLKYVYNVSEESKFTSIFSHCFAARLAHELCQYVTGSSAKSQELWQLYNNKRQEAKSINALQKTPQPVVGNSWLDSR